METMVPKLVAEDIPLLNSLLSDVFPGVKYCPAEMEALRREVKKVCQEMFLVYGEGDEQGVMWVEKVLQLYQITQLHHGLMMVGPSGSGKSMAWHVLLKALERLEGVEGVAHVIDPKVCCSFKVYFTYLIIHRKLIKSLRLLIYTVQSLYNAMFGVHRNELGYK